MKQINNLYLFIGVLGGLTAALLSILGHSGDQLPDYAVARVNDSYITRAVYERAVNAMDTDKRNPMTPEDRKHVLSRLIDEELLIQYGIRQGLVRSDRQVKSTLVQSVIQAKSLQAEARDIPEEDARGFFRDNRQLFSRTDRVRVGMIRVPANAGDDPDQARELARARAQQAGRRLTAGESFESVSNEYHQGGVLNLPDTPLPYGKLVDYLGPTLAKAAFELEVSTASAPLLIGQAWQVLYVRERFIAPPSSFDEVREPVLAEMRRRAAEDIVRKSLNEMRRTETIRIAEDLR